jgi:2'-hydroxyisoflavone reductase
VDEALSRGHAVTVFNRGRSPAVLPAAVERLTGDRYSNLAALEGRRWDAVVDTCGYLPSVVRDSARLLAGAVEHYTFVSSLSVYASFDAPGIDESAPVGALTGERLEEVEAARPGGEEIVTTHAELYGPLKALCELAAEASFPGRALQVRAGLIVGPQDYMDRLPWWIRRVVRGGDVLVPGPPDRPVQLVDVRDLAGWIVRMAGAFRAGTFNATGPSRELTLRELLETCRDVTDSGARFVWVDEGFLLEKGVAPWSELPLWLPESGYAGFFRVDCRKAFVAGLTFRPPAETIRDVASWQSGDRAIGGKAHERGRGGRTGLDPKKEEELLREWRQVRAGT